MSLSWLLNQEQLVRIQRNKAETLLRLQACNVRVGFGELEEAPQQSSETVFYKANGICCRRTKHYSVYPPPHQVFTWTQTRDMRDVKVVILGQGPYGVSVEGTAELEPVPGQGPYDGPSQAHGLCFSVQRPFPPPPNLGNIYKELSTDIGGFLPPGHGDLSGWAKQGVLLLKAVALSGPIKPIRLRRGVGSSLAMQSCPG